jgi:hypothetical protein
MMTSRLIFLHHRHLNQIDVVIEKSEVLNILVPQGDAKATAKVDSSKSQPRSGGVAAAGNSCFRFRGAAKIRNML